jgi:hypothetical protein
LTVTDADDFDRREHWMPRKPQFSFDPVLSIGTVLSLGLAIGFYFYDELPLTMATFAGLLGLIITLQVQDLTEERRRAERESRMGAMIAQLENNSWLAGVVESMLRSTTTVERAYPGTPAVTAYRQVMEDCRAHLAEMESGRFRFPYADKALELRLCETLQREFLAISVAALDLRWWLAAEGRRYWRYQHEALGRGAAIRRVFIYDDWSDELERMAREQRDAGVEVRRVHRDDLPVGARGIIGIWDMACACEVIYDAAGAAVLYSYTVADADLERLRRQFEQVERMAIGLD